MPEPDLTRQLDDLDLERRLDDYALGAEQLFAGMRRQKRELHAALALARPFVAAHAAGRVRREILAQIDAALAIPIGGPGAIEELGQGKRVS
jgi:hypothetical protein